MQNRDGFINEFYKLKNYNPKTTEPLIDRIDEYLANNGPDVKLEILSHTLKAQKEITLNNDFIKACEIAKPVVDILQDADWDLFELDIFILVLDWIESYELAIAMMKKAHDILDNKFSDLEVYDYKKLKIFGESSARHLRAKYYDNADPKKVKKMFDICVDSAIKICEKYNYFTFRNVQLTWRAIFEEDVNKILECTDGIVATKNNYWITVVKNNIAEYARHLGKNVTTKLKNLVIGWQIKKRRKELGISTKVLADMIDTSQSIVNQIERGASGVSQRRLYVIAQALGVDNIAYFTGGPLTKAPAIASDTHSHIVSQIMSNMSDEDNAFIADFVKLYNDKVKNRNT